MLLIYFVTKSYYFWSKNLKVSVIIPAKNEEKYIISTIRSVKNNCYQLTEIIVVCNGCTDNTARLAASEGALVIETQNNGVSHARNLGAQASSGNFFLFLDADTMLSENALRFLVDSYTQGIAISSLPVKPDINTPLAQLYMWLKSICMSNIYAYSNGVIFCSRKIFEEIGGFDVTKHKREDGYFMRSAIKKCGRFRVERRAFCVTSMRRYQHTGYLQVPCYWIKQTIKEFLGIEEYTHYDDIR